MVPSWVGLSPPECCACLTRRGNRAGSPDKLTSQWPTRRPFLAIPETPSSEMQRTISYLPSSISKHGGDRGQDGNRLDSGNLGGPFESRVWRMPCRGLVKFELGASPAMRVTCPWRMQRSLFRGTNRFGFPRIGTWLAPRMGALPQRERVLETFACLEKMPDLFCTWPVC